MTSKALRFPMFVKFLIGCLSLAAMLIVGGTYVVKDATDAMPWLPNGPIKHTVTWTLPGYTAPSDGSAYVMSGV